MAKATAKKKAAPALSEDEAKLMTVVAKLEKDFGDGVIRTFEGTPSLPKFPRQVPSGSIGLDIALGVMWRKEDGRWQTGYGPGRIIEIFGGEGSGKTTLCVQFVANAQALGIRCAYLDMEHTLDVSYAQKLGVDMTKLYFAQPDSGEQCMQIAEALVKSGLFGCVVIDSVAALVPEVELEGEIGESAVGAQARLMSSSLRNLNTQLNQGAQCNLVFTNQLREKIGVRFGSPKTTPGGNALKFYASNRIEVWRGSALKEGENQYGHELNMTVLKNKNAPPFQKAKSDLIYGKGIDYIGELVDLCAGRGIVVTSGSWYSAYGKQLGQGKKQAGDRIRENPTLAYHLYNDLMTAVMADRGYSPTGDPIPGAHDPSKAIPSVAATFVPSVDADDVHGIEAGDDEGGDDEGGAE